MVNGKEAMVEEFVLHRIGASEAESVFNDFSAVLKGPEEQEFLRKLFLKPFSTALHTCEFARAKGAKKGRAARRCAPTSRTARTWCSPRSTSPST